MGVKYKGMGLKGADITPGMMDIKPDFFCSTYRDEKIYLFAELLNV